MVEVKISKKPIKYKKALKYLEKRVVEVQTQDKNELLWILEHPKTYTAGIRSSENEILNKKIKVIKTNRGGKITLHNPGQKVVYFVINLNKRKKDVRKLVRIIEKSIIEFLKCFKIRANADRKNVGIWVNDKKIAAIGIRIRKWIAFHGCSINISNNLKDYLLISPCGLDNTKVTSIKNEGKNFTKNINLNLKKIFLKNLK